MPPKSKTVKFSGEMLPWVKSPLGENVQVKITDPVQGEMLQRAMPKELTDNFAPYRGGIVHVRPPHDEWRDYWEKKAKGLKGKQVQVVATARPFDGECIDYGPEHGWALDMISIEIIKKKG